MSITFKILTVCFSCVLLSINASREDADLFLKYKMEPLLTQACYDMNKARFEFKTDLLNEEKVEAYINASRSYYSLEESLLDELFVMDIFSENSSAMTEDFERQILIAFTKRLGFRYQNFSEEILRDNIMVERNYGSARICPYNQHNCRLPDEGMGIADIMNVVSTSTHYDELVYLWEEWRDVTGRKLRPLYERYAEMQEQNAKNHKETNNGYLEGDFAPESIRRLEPLRLWREVEPLYRELHKYVARKLKNYYGDDLDISDGLIPVHVLGSIFGENWYNIEHIVKPFPDFSDGDVEGNLKRQYTVAHMLQAVEEFHQSLGLESFGDVYGEPDQMIIKPDDDREVNCLPESFDLCNGEYRLILCSEVNMVDYMAMHHEFGHIQYFKQYSKQPYLFRTGAEFIQESIGDVFALSALTPKDLRAMSLVTEYKESYETSINYLMRMALLKVAFLPFGLIVDLWRWDILDGKVGKEEMNTHWWRYKKEFQKVKPPVPRSDETDFDIGAKYRLVAGVGYMRNYFAHFAQFQIYKSLCWRAHLVDPVDHKICPLCYCDFYHSLEAGDLLKEALQAGRSKEWQDVYQNLTGSTSVTADALLDYFQPLYEYLVKENQKAERIPPPETTNYTTEVIITCLVIAVIIFVAAAYSKYIRTVLRRIRAFLRDN